MPELLIQAYRVPLPGDSAPGMGPVVRALEAETKADYALIRAGENMWVLGIHPLCRLIVDVQGVARVDGPLADRLGIAPLPAGDPLTALENVVGAVAFSEAHQLLGWMGFVSYDVARFLEPVLAEIGQGSPPEAAWPAVFFSLFEHYLVMEAGEDSAKGFSLGAETPAAFDWSGLLVRATRLPSDVAVPAALRVEQTSRETYMSKVQRIKDYIAAGDIYQANLAQRWVFQTASRPADVFARLCAISPAPHAACLRFHDGLAQRHVVSASPELFLDVRPDTSGTGGGRAVTRPIKGTRPRDLADPQRDAALHRELLASAKDHAELTMIVDLLRNDLGRVAEFGSVRVAQARQIEAHPTVWHTVATVAARLRPEAGLAEILRALCPGGSITGAPKIRAMQIIQELEGFSRGLYCGNIGMLGPRSQRLLLNIAIRTVLFSGNKAAVCAGGGIVADSDPQREFEETGHKARALLEALNGAGAAREQS